MRIIGWTDWDNQDYPEMFPFTGTPYNHEEVEAVEAIISKELRDRGYKFTGSYHQNGDFGTPIFDTGEVFKCSQRTWGGIMADAYPDEIDNSDGYGYVKWAWVEPEGEVSVLPSGKEL